MDNYATHSAQKSSGGSSGTSDAIGEFLDEHNEDPKPFIWTKSADQIIAAVQPH